MNTAWSTPTKYVVGVSLALLGIVVLYLSRSVIPPLIVAALLAVIVRPLIVRLHERSRLSHGCAVAVVYLVVLLAVPLVIAFLVPAVINALRYIAGLDYESILLRSTAWLRATLTAIKVAQLPLGALDAYIDQSIDSLLGALEGATTITTLPAAGTIIDSLGAGLTVAFGAAAGLIGELFSAVVLLVFTFLASIYISLNPRRYPDALLRMVPAAYRPEITMLLEEIGQVWNGFFRGQLTLMLVIGVMIWLGLTILGVPGALSLGIIAGLLEVVPTLGPIIATIPAVIVALLQGSNYLPLSPLAMAGLVILFYVIVQQLENSLVVPRVLGGAVNLPPLVVMTGVLVGASVGGILGALLATPVIASARDILRYAYCKLLGEEPFPPPADVPQAGSDAAALANPCPENE